MKNLTLEIIHDTSPENPFENTDGLYPTITDKKDYSDGDIDKYLQSYLSKNQLVFFQSKLYDLLEINKKEFYSDYPMSGERMDTLNDLLCEFIEDSMENKAAFCEMFGIKHLFKTSRGYSQGQSSEVFICWTPEFEKITGVSYQKVTESDMEGTFKLYGYWAWGDCYGFKVIENEKCECCGECCGEWKETEVNSCWGFYGQNHFESGLAEYVRESFTELSDLEFKEMIEGIEVKY